MPAVNLTYFIGSSIFLERVARMKLMAARLTWLSKTSIWNPVIYAYLFLVCDRNLSVITWASFFFKDWQYGPHLPVAIQLAQDFLSAFF